MAALRILSQLIALFLGAAGFLFGQVFTGTFSVGGTLAGVGGVLAGALGNRDRRLGRRAVLASCAIGLVGAAIHVYEYYSTAHVAGNYYAWFLTLPFALALIVIASQSAKRTGGDPGRRGYLMR